MFLQEAEWMFVGFLLSFSGVLGRTTRICGLKGSSVDLHCSAEHPTSSFKWYERQWNGTLFVWKKIHVDGDRVKCNMSKENCSTLSIANLTKDDAKEYCCRKTTENTDDCHRSKIRLQVTDLQVKVFPTTDGHTVTLMCSTSCPLTEQPAFYIWYKNRELLYQDPSPWYQEMVSSEKSLRYSCAVKGFEHLRAPEVSVDSVTSGCFSVSYANGGLCSYNQTSVNESCSINYPTDINIQKKHVNSDHVRLTCDNSCSNTPILWYKNRKKPGSEKIKSVPVTSTHSFSCAVKGFEDLHSPEVCVDDTQCVSVNYVSRRICALIGSSVNLSSKYSHPNYLQPKSKLWYKIKRIGQDEDEVLDEAVSHDNMRDQHTVTINKLKKTDEAEYKFRLQHDDQTQSNFPGVTLFVTGLTVTFTPSAVVTVGQRVTLTCSTSCPLTNNTNYIWYLNDQPLMQPEDQNKHLVLDPVSTQHAGDYSCTVKSQRDIRLPGETLTVRSNLVKQPVAAVVCAAALLVLIVLSVVWWIRISFARREKMRKRQSLELETTNNLEEINLSPVYEEVSAQPTEQEDTYYSTACFPQNNTDSPYSTIQDHFQQDQSA